MFKAIRIGVLLLILLVVAVNSWLSQVRSTDWDNSLWVKVYPINADGSDATARYIDTLTVRTFAEIETFVAREAGRYGRRIERPVRLELGREIGEQPPQLGARPNVFSVMLWSLKMRWWVGSVTDPQDDIEPDVSIFLRYHQAAESLVLEDSVGVRKGMFGVVNAFTGRRHAGRNNVVIAHEILHTVGATDKYGTNGEPVFPTGYAAPDNKPRYPQTRAEIMAARIPLSANTSRMAYSLDECIINPITAAEINWIKQNPD